MKMIMNMKIETIWQTLESDQSFTGGLLYKRYAAHIKADILVGIKGEDKKRWIGIGYSENIRLDISRFDTLKDILVDTRPNPSVSNVHLFVISLENHVLKDIFSIVCEDLISEVSPLSDTTVILRGILKRLEKWQLLFEQYRLGSMSIEAQHGLYGELNFLRKIIEQTNNAATCLQSWMGTSAYFHDFHWDTWAIEVKTSSLRSQNQIHISNKAQLDNDKLQFLGICHYILDTQTNKGETLNQVIEQLIDLFYQLDTSLVLVFKNKLLEVGYFKEHHAAYDSTHYIVVNTKYYRIKEGFPRLIPSNIPLEIEDVKYILNIDLCQNHQIEESNVFKNIF